MSWSKYKLERAELQLFRELELLVRSLANMLSIKPIDDLLDKLDKLRRLQKRESSHL